MKALVLVVLLLGLWRDCDGETETLQQEESVCRNQDRVKFDPEPPRNRRKRLDMCNQYRSNTCCNSSSVQTLKRPVHKTRVANFNEKCREITEDIICRPCHPFVGTGRINRICDNLCSSWYEACKDEYYSGSMGGKLTPCYGNALICSPLREIVSDGEGFCKRMGFENALTTDEDGVDCFDGSVPNEKGVDEPEESIEDFLRRVFNEQATNPSDFYTFMALATILVLFLSSKIWGKLRSSDHRLGTSEGPEASTLSLHEIREMQQKRYQEFAQGASYGSSGAPIDLASSSDESDDDEADEH